MFSSRLLVCLEVLCGFDFQILSDKLHQMIRNSVFCWINSLLNLDFYGLLSLMCHARAELGEAKGQQIQVVEFSLLCVYSSVCRYFSTVLIRLLRTHVYNAYPNFSFENICKIFHSGTFPCSDRRLLATK